MSKLSYEWDGEAISRCHDFTDEHTNILQLFTTEIVVL